MGLHPDVKNKLISAENGYPDTRALLQPAGHPPERKDGSGRGARLFDEFTFIRAGPERVTMGDLYEAFLLRHIGAHRAGYHTTVAMFDDLARVPSQKHTTQSERDRKVVPYHEHSKLDAGGIMEPGQTRTMIERSRFAATRSLRPQMCEWIRQRLSTQLDRLGNCRLIMDYDAKGPWELTAHGARQLHSLAHPFGEADLQATFWARVMNDDDIYVDTIDGDIFLILLHFQRMCGSSGSGGRRLYYQWSVTKDNHTYIDMEKALEVIGGRLTPLTLACLMAGTDFIEKKNLTHRLGTPSMMDWAMENKNNKWFGTELWDVSYTLNDSTNVWPWPLSHPYCMRAHVLGGGADVTVRDTHSKSLREVQESMFKYVSKTAHKIPDADVEMVAWNLQYWLVNLLLVKARLEPFARSPSSSSSLSSLSRPSGGGGSPPPSSSLPRPSDGGPPPPSSPAKRMLLDPKRREYVHL